MNCKIVIDKTRDEEVVVYAHARTPLVDAVEQLVANTEWDLLGYRDRESKRLSLAEVCCFTVENNRIFARIGADRWQIKCRLYQLEKQLPESFIKINQSCIANIRQMERFDASFSGTLLVTFKNGHTDYVSRRNLKHVKERLGLK